MRFYNINTQGKLWLDRRASLPAWAAGDEGRIAYDESSEDVYVGQSADWARVMMVGGKIVGDIWSDNELVKVLENSADGVNPWFRGNIVADDGSVILENSPIISGAWFRGQIYSVDGTTCLFNNATPALATFTGTSEKAKYA